MILTPSKTDKKARTDHLFGKSYNLKGSNSFDKGSAIDWGIFSPDTDWAVHWVNELQVDISQYPLNLASPEGLTIQFLDDPTPEDDSTEAKVGRVFVDSGTSVRRYIASLMEGHATKINRFSPFPRLIIMPDKVDGDPNSAHVTPR